MKSVMKLLMALSMAFFLSACGGGTSDGSDWDGGDTTGGGLSVYDVSNGYEFQGTSSYGESVTLYFYSDGTYEYYRGSEYFSGTYYTDSSGVVMSDYDGGSYILYADSYGEFYEGGTFECPGECPGLGRELTIYNIESM